MVRKYLSVDYKNRFLKSFSLVMSNLTTLVTFIISISYLIWGIEQKVEIVTVSQLFFWHSLAYNYFKLKSKDVLYDEKNIYIRNGQHDFIELPFDQIIKIKRFYFYFYQITYKDNLTDQKNIAYYLIPDPHTFSRQKELKEISSYAKNSW